MLQFNLLPDVKKDYIRVKRTKRLIMSLSVISAGVAISIVLLLFMFVQFSQKGHIDRLTKDINSEIAAIKSIEDLDKILTIQHQLESIPNLHGTKPETSRLFNYLNQVTPIEVKISEVSVDFVSNTMIVKGRADSLASINKYADTLKFVTYTTNDERTAKPFSQVVTELSRSDSESSYSINLAFDPLIFDNKIEVVLTIPQQVTTRSVVGQPSLSEQQNNLFEDAPAPEGGQQ